MKYKPEVKDLVQWLETHSKAELAVLLDYKTTNTIVKWIENNEIPRRMRSAVAQIIAGEK
jgi:hypothetical protein